MTDTGALLPDRPLRIGLIGASRIANRAIIEPAREVDGVEVTAVAARDFDRAAAFAGRHGIPKSFGSYAEIIESADVDLVYVATPPFNHASLAIDCLHGGKSVLVEKPFALDASEAMAVFATAEQTGLRVFEAMHSLHHPLERRLKTILADPRLGRLQRIDGRFCTQIATAPDEYRWNASLGGGALLDLGIYPLAWARALAGEPTGVTSAAADMVGGVDGALTAELAFRRGVTAGIRCSMLAGDHDASLALRCEGGQILVEGMVAPHRGNRVTVFCAGGGWSESVARPTSYAAQLTAVRDSLAGRSPFPRSEDDFVRSMAAIDMIRAALL